MKAPMKTFSELCKGLYEPLLEKTWQKLHSSTKEIAGKYASRGFSIPPGTMYVEIGECYKADIPKRAEIIFDSCCQAYRASALKPEAEEFSKELTDAISREQNRILASGEADLNQFNVQFKIPTYQATLERYKSEVLSEGRRLLKHYSARANVFLGESAELASSQSASNSTYHWYQRPIGNIGLSVVGGVLVVLIFYLFKLYLGLAL